MASTIKPNHEAQMRPLVLTVTANHTLAYTGGEVHDTITGLGPFGFTAIHYQSLSMANAIRREAEGSTAALLARVFA
ncbi:hypothetical protein [Caulobacter segnis]